jgi:hypothetical protein
LIGEIVLQGGLQRRNYAFFSVLSPSGLRDAKTVGVFGVVFGPTFETSYPCPSDIEIAEPEFTDFASLPVVLTFSLQADGTILHEGATINQTQLAELIRNVEDKHATGIELRASGKCRARDVNEIAEMFLDSGFRVRMAVQVEPSTATQEDEAAAGSRLGQ